VFSVVNLIELHLGVRLLVILTLLAIAELFLYQGAVVSSFDLNFIRENPFGTLDFQTFMAAIPYAIWLFLAIEGISLMTKDIENTNLRRTIGRGYYAAFFTLLALALLVLFLAAGGIDWDNPASKSILEENHPMPASLALILGREHVLVQIFTFIGLFGLIASLQGVALAATTQLETLLPTIEIKFLSQRAIAALLVFIVSSGAILVSQTGFLIELSVFGAVCMYLAVCLSLIFLRGKSQPKKTDATSIKRYFHSNFNGILSAVSAWGAAAIALLCIVAFAQLQFTAFVIFIVCGILYASIKHRN
jgi:ethanolamine permease